MISVTGLNCSALAAASAWVERFTPARSAEAVLGAVQLIARGDELWLAAYDFETLGQARLPAVVKAEGRAFLSARLLSAVAKTMKTAGTAEIDTSGTTGRVSSGGSEWELPSLDERDYPKIPGVPEAVGTVDGAALAAALARVLPAASVPTAVPFCGAVALSGTTDTLTLATTDRFRMAVAEIAWTSPAGLDEIMVPATALREAVSVAKGATEVTIGADTHGWSLSAEHFAVVARYLGDAKMPWRRIDMDPDTADATVVLVETAEFRSALDRATVVLDKEESVSIEFDEDAITVEPTVGSRSRARHCIEPLGVVGEAQSMGVNPAYLRTALDGLGSYAARFAFTAKRWAPVLIQPADEQGDPLPGYRHVVAQQRMTKGVTP